MSGTRRKPGRLGPFVEGYRAWLVAREYTPQTTRNMLKELGVLGCWMSEQGVEPGELDAAAIERLGGAARRRAAAGAEPARDAPVGLVLARGGCHGPRAGPG